MSYSRYESNENMTITCSTKVCSFGKQVVEKVETEYARFESGRFVYRIHRSPMCEYMVNFIHKLKHLPEKYMMNSVLENFTILQVSIVIFHSHFTSTMPSPLFWILLVILIMLIRVQLGNYLWRPTFRPSFSPYRVACTTTLVSDLLSRHRILTAARGSSRIRRCHYQTNLMTRATCIGVNIQFIYQAGAMYFKGRACVNADCTPHYLV